MGFELTTLVVIATDCIGSYKSNYHTITTMMIPFSNKNDSNEIKYEKYNLMRHIMTGRNLFGQQLVDG